MNVGYIIAQQQLFRIADSIPNGLTFTNAEIIFEKNHQKHYISNKKYIETNMKVDDMIRDLLKIYGELK